MSSPQENAVVFGMPAAVYHSDPCAVPSLSASIAHVLATQSPLHAWQQHPRFGGTARASTREKDFGTIAHSVLLGLADGELVVVDADDYRTADARAARDAARESGKTPVLRQELIEVQTAVDGISKRLRALGVPRLTGKSEVSLFWTERADDGTVVQCRGRMDHLLLTKRAAYILDLKTARSAHPRSCAAHAYEYGYDVQAAAYRSAFAKLYPRYAGREVFMWLFAELVPPFAVTPCELDGSYQALGEMRWRRAINTWAACLNTGSWPGYTQGIIRLEAPAWAITQEEEIAYGQQQH